MSIESFFLVIKYEVKNMDLEKIKSWVIERKLYILGICMLVGGIFWYQNSQNKAADNNYLLNKSNQNSVENISRKVDRSNSSLKSDQVEVTCDISGAINKEGVYTLKKGARVDTLIKAAGGVKSNADLRAVNRAVVLKDQEKIHIPYKGEVNITAANDQAASNDSLNNDKNKVHLNTATAADLQKLNGIGEKKAEQIIAYREQKGEFKKIEDLTQVSGIGEKTFAALKDQLAL